jgi:hypothetical protein
MNWLIRKEKLSFPTVIVHPQDTQQGRFPCPRGPHDSDEFAFRDVQIDLPKHITESGLGFETLLHIAEPNHRGAGFHGSIFFSIYFHRRIHVRDPSYTNESLFFSEVFHVDSDAHSLTVSLGS